MSGTLSSTWTPTNSCSTSATQSKFGTRSLFIDGNNYKYATLAADSSFNAVTSDWTLEMWVYHTSTSSSSTQGGSNASGKTACWGTSTGSTKDLTFFLQTIGPIFKVYSQSQNLEQSVSSTVTLNTWTHIALCYTSSTKLFRAFVNGVNSSGTFSASAHTDNLLFNHLALGARPDFASSNLQMMVGYIDELRVSNTVRYTTGFTPAVTAFTADANTLVLNHFDNVSNINPTPVPGYQWTSSAGATTIASSTNLTPKTGLSAGTYTLVITDSALATKTVVYTITDPYVTLALTTPGTVTHATYYGGATGSVTAPTLAGNGTPFRYSWTSSGTIATNVTAITSSDLTFVTAGTYVLTVTDSTLRTVSTTYTIAQPILLTSSQTDITTSSPTGTCTVSAVGGLNTTYVYAWTKAGSAIAPTTATITGLTAGKYVCTVTNSTFTSTASFEIATYLTTILSPTTVRASWTTITGALNYRVYYTVSGSSTKTLYTGTTLATTSVISNLTPVTTYLIEVYSTTDGVNYIRSFASTVTTPAASAANFTKNSVLTVNNIYDITAVQTSTAAQLGATPSTLVNTAFANGDTVIASATAVGSTTTQAVSVLKRSFTLTLDKSGKFFLPFDSTDLVSVQTATLTLSDASTKLITYNAASNSITIDSVTYNVGSRLVLDNQTTRIYAA